MNRRWGIWGFRLTAGLLVAASAWAVSGACAKPEDEDLLDGSTLCPAPYPRCGNRCVELSTGETCDDGNHDSGDGCDPYCRVETAGCPTATPRCGDGCVDGGLGETCDDGNTAAGDGCSPACRVETGADADADVGDVPRDDAAIPDDAGRDDAVTDTGTCPESPCRLMPQCGCTGGQKCTIDNDLSTETTLVKTCAPAGPNDTSDTCTADDDCQAGTGCFGLFSESGTASVGMCYRYCGTGSDCTGAGSVCVPLTTTSAYPGYCSHACNIMTGSGCPSGTKCMPLTLSATGTLLTDCTSDAGYGTAGDSCYAEEDCGAGTFCGAASSIYECIAYCSNPPSGYCPLGYSCQSFTTPFDIGGVEYGYCY